MHSGSSTELGFQSFENPEHQGMFQPDSAEIQTGTGILLQIPVPNKTDKKPECTT